MEFNVFEFEGMRYVKTYPTSFKKEEKYPVIIMLHGAGGRGDDIEKIKGHPFFKATDGMKEFPFIVFAPQCHENTWFDMIPTLKRLVCMIVQDESVDSKRIYLMGASMGGYTTWQLAMSMPEMFAAIVPICGGGMYWNAERLVNVPVWAFHGKLDTCVFVEESEKMVEAVNKRGGNATLTIYPDKKHNSWDATFSNPEVYKWMLSNVNSNEIMLTDEYKDTKIYG